MRRPTDNYYADLARIIQLTQALSPGLLTNDDIGVLVEAHVPNSPLPPVVRDIMRPFRRIAHDGGLPLRDRIALAEIRRLLNGMMLHGTEHVARLLHIASMSLLETWPDGLPDEILECVESMFATSVAAAGLLSEPWEPARAAYVLQPPILSCVSVLMEAMPKYPEKKSSVAAILNDVKTAYLILEQVNTERI